MDIGRPIRGLGAIDMVGLHDAIMAIDDAAWREDDIRQTKFNEVHSNTESLIGIFCDHDNWPRLDVVKGRAWDRLAEHAVPIMHKIIADHYPKGGTIIRAVAAKLKAGCHIATHTDRHPSFHRGHRIHIPITTNSKVRFMIDGRPHIMNVGEAYEINNQRRHGVLNKGDEDRISFIFDYMPRSDERA